MSIETSEIVTALNTAIRQGVVDLHNQTMNDVQAIVGNSELRMLRQIAELQDQVSSLRAELERRAPLHLPPERQP